MQGVGGYRGAAGQTQLGPPAWEREGDAPTHREPEQQAGLADARVANQQELRWAGGERGGHVSRGLCSKRRCAGNARLPANSP